MIVGIVAEYNPFHNGHKLQIAYAKDVLGADAVVVAMSGSFTQRGEIACFDKYTRAEAALRCGADIVFEIPTIFATSSAREFASAGVQLLASTGIVNTILFGAETDDVNIFKSSAKSLVELEKSGELDFEINEAMSNGISFAEARANALSKHIPSDIISNPNNILGLEYCRYIYENNLPLDIAIIKRQGNDYNDENLTGEISSATAIRRALKNKESVTAISTEAAQVYSKATYVDADDISQLLHYKLLSINDYERYLDCSADLADRIRNHINEYVNFRSFCDLLKTKNINRSRVTRVLSHILLDITTEDFDKAKAVDYISYIRMLGFSKNGARLLGEIKEKSSVSLITKPTEIIDKQDIFSSNIYNAILTSKTNQLYPNEYTRKFNLANL